MTVFIALLVVFLFGMFMGSYAFFRLMISTYKTDPNMVLKHLNGPEDVIKSSNDPSKVALVIEYHGSKVYMFFKHDDVFAGQGSSIEEALEQAIQRFPGVKFSVEQ